MSEFVLNRNYTLRSLHGRIVNFEKGVPVWVPPQVEKEALQIGALPVDGQKDILDAEEVVARELTAEERKAQIIAAFETIAHREDRADYTGQGMPNLEVLKVLTSFTVNSKERDAVWKEYKSGADE